MYIETRHNKQTCNLRYCALVAPSLTCKLAVKSETR